jgi:putative transposase
MSNQRGIIYDQRYTHFITFSVDRRWRLLDHDHAKRIGLGWLGEALDQYLAWCVGFVVMLDHVHVLIWLAKTGQLSAFIHSWKGRSSLALREWYRQHAAESIRHFGEGDRFWQPKYYSFEIDQRPKLDEKLQDMHDNRARAGIVQRDADWKWSSAGWSESRRWVGDPIYGVN